MAIRLNLDRVLLARRMSLAELSDRVGIKVADLALLRSGQALAIRFATLDALCRELDCQPADLMTYGLAEDG
jgi:putative transcriptional regulator